MEVYKNTVKTAISSGAVKETGDGYSVVCPICNTYRTLKTRENVRRALKYGRKCNGCSRKICNTGKKHSNFRKQSMSAAHKKRYFNIAEHIKTSIAVKVAMHRPDVRKKHLDALHNSNWLKVKCDNGQLEFLEKWNRLGFNFTPNYQVKSDLDLFYLDGYDKNKSVVVEYDSPYHLKNNQIKRDLHRQQRIIDLLQPKKFWRYNTTNKSVKNVLCFQ